MSESQDFTARDIPRQAQRQDALNDQLNDLHMAAIRLGLYDAADWITRCLGDSIAGRAQGVFGSFALAEDALEDATWD